MTTAVTIVKSTFQVFNIYAFRDTVILMVRQITDLNLKWKLESQWLEGYCRNTTFFPNRVALTRKCALSRESTLIGGGRGPIVWNGRFFSILLFGWVGGG